MDERRLPKIAGGVAAPSPPATAWEPIDLRGTLPTRAGARPYFSRDVGALVGKTIHYTASSPFADFEAIARYQTGPNAQEAFPAIAYTLGVDYRGNVYLLHDLSTRVWHSDGTGRNAHWVGIVWVGGIGDGGVPNAEQVSGLRTASAWVDRKVGRKLALEGHKEASSTSCPGNWAAYRSKLL